MVTIRDVVYLTTREAAEKIGRSANHIYHFYREYGWRRHKYGRNVLFEKEQIDDWLEKNIHLEDTSSGSEVEVVS